MSKKKRSYVYPCPKCGIALKKIKRNPNSLRCKKCEEIFDEGNLIKLPRLRNNPKLCNEEITSFFMMLKRNKKVKNVQQNSKRKF